MAEINLNYNPHKFQKQIHDDTARFKVVVAGRRFGKSVLARMHVLLNALYIPGLYWIVCPTYKQGKMIHWRELKKEVPIELITYKNEQELSIELVNGSRIEIKGADNENSLRGVGIKGVIFDETADQQPHVFWDIIRPTLIDSEGWAIFIGTPRGFNWFYDLYLRGTKGTKEYEEDWSAYKFSSYDNPHLNPKEIDSAKLSTDEDSFSQEYLAEFKKFKGLIYKGFDRSVHVIEPFEIPNDGNWEIYRGVDFGFGNPTACVFVAVNNESKKWYVIDEYYENKESTDYHCGIILSKSAQYPSVSISWGDPSAAQVMADWAKKGLYITPARKDGNTNRGEWVGSGIDIIIEKLKVSPMDNKPQLFIFKNCENLIREFEGYEWEEPKNELLNAPGRPKKANDHACFCRHAPILTHRGILPIIKVKKGDKVWTPIGWSKVLAKKSTGKQILQNFQLIKATGNHPFLTQVGFRPLSSLKEADKLWNVSISKASHIGGTQIRQNFPIKGISVVLKRAIQVKLDFSTKTYGLFSKGKFQKVFTSIIKILITIEMILKILRWSVMPNIASIILNLLEGLLKKEVLLDKRKRGSSIKVKKGKNFIVGLVKGFGKLKNLLIRFAIIAVKSMSPGLREVNSVALTARCQCSGLKEVYNLLTDSGMFTVQGVVAKNCDALRYFACSYIGRQNYYLPPDEKGWSFS